MLQRSLDRARARRSDEGFTLIELLIVIIILGILAAIVVFSVTGITDKGKTSACKADVETITVAAEAYLANNDTTSTAPGYPHDGTAAATMTVLKTIGLIHSVPTDVNYAGSGSTYTVSGVGC